MKIAIIGTGISGLGAAHILSQKHDITLYEKNDYVGGHSRTVDIKTPDANLCVDTGFIVFNERNYPHLLALFSDLGVPVTKSNMSFGVSINEGWLEYSTSSLMKCFAQKRNTVRPDFLRMLADIVKFHKMAITHQTASSDVSLGDWLEQLNLGPWFRDYFLLPMGGAIWSMPVEKMLSYPASTFIRFFENHGLLGVNDAPQWYTVIGGSRNYVDQISKNFRSRIKLNCAVKQVIRQNDRVDIIDEQNETTSYDQVVFACHSDQALALLCSPTTEEQQILGSINYQQNVVVLHTDSRYMPKRKSAWSSWVYLSNHKNDKSESMSVSYWMNNLQPLETNTPIIVTLNPSEMPRHDLIYDQTILDHPLFNSAAIKAQSSLDLIQGKDRIWYCGAWQGYGFHEDGLSSAVQMTGKMGVLPSWC